MSAAIMSQEDPIKATLEDISSVKKRLLVEVEPSEVEKKLTDAYRELGKQARVPGFRAGKVPRQVLEKRFGAQIEEDVLRNLMGETLPRAVDLTHAFPIGPPIIEREALERGKVFRYSAVLEVRPPFELDDYAGLRVERERIVVTDAQVEEQLRHIREAQGNLRAMDEDRGLKTDDYAVIEYRGFQDGTPLKGIEASDFMLKLGSNDFHPRFEEALKGMKKGEEKRFSVDFEEGYRHKGLAGRQVEFQVRIDDIRMLSVPDLTDELAKALDPDLQTVEDLRNKVREMITAQEEKRADREVQQRLIRAISDAIEFELPQGLVENELNSAVENVRQNLLRSGSSLEKAGLSVDRLKEEFRASAEKRVKDMLILGKIAEKEGLLVTEEDLEQGFRQLSAAMGQEVEVIRNYYEARNLTDSLRDKLLEEKTLKYLTDHAKIVDMQLKNPEQKAADKAE